MAKQISVVGGHGQIARLPSRKLVARGREVRGLVRSDDQLEDLRDDGAEPALYNLETAEGSDIDDVLAGSDVVVFAAGAGPDSGPERKRALDRDGAVKSAARIGAERFVIISSMGADDPPDDDANFSVYLRASTTPTWLYVRHPTASVSRTRSFARQADRRRADRGGAVGGARRPG